MSGKIQIILIAAVSVFLYSLNTIAGSLSESQIYTAKLGCMSCHISESTQTKPNNVSFDKSFARPRSVVVSPTKKGAKQIRK